MIQLKNNTPYQAKIYSNISPTLPITWICVVKASFSFSKQGELTLLQPSHPIREYDTYIQSPKKNLVHYSHETMSTKLGAEFVLVWDEIHSLNQHSKIPLHVLCDYEYIHYIKTHDLLSLGYLLPNHPARRKQYKQKPLYQNVAPLKQRLAHKFTGNEEIQWWWGENYVNHGFYIPKLPLTLTSHIIQTNIQASFAWDTLCIVMDRKQCHLIGRSCFPALQRLDSDWSIHIESNP